MKKINKTVLLASTLFISQVLVGNTKSFASEEYKLDVERNLHNQELIGENKEDYSFVSYDSSAIKTPIDKDTIKNVEDDKARAYQENLDEAYKEAEEEKLNVPAKIKIDNLKKDTKANTQVSKDEKLAEDIKDNTKKAKEAYDPSIIYYDNTKLDDSLKQSISSSKNTKLIEEKQAVEETSYYSQNSGGYFVKKNGQVSYYQNNKLITNTNIKVKDKIYRADAKGAISNPKNTWLNVGNDIYYTNADGRVTTGFTQIENKKYFFGNSGVLQRNKKIIANGFYYNVTDSGYLRTQANSWVNVNKNIYRTLEDGSIARGVTKIGDFDYMFDKDGKLQTNTKLISSNKFYEVNPMGVVTNPKDAWVSLNGGTYRTNSNGEIIRGAQDINGNTYVFDYKTGKMIQGEKVISNGKFYEVDSEGIAQNPKNSWIDYKGHRYHTNEDGSLQKGVWKIDGNNYYFGNDGLVKNSKAVYRNTEYRIDNNGIATPIDMIDNHGENNLDKAIEWMFQARDNKLTYNMGAARNSSSAADCSSAVYRSLINGGFLPKDAWIGNTESLFSMGDRANLLREVTESDSMVIFS